MHSQLFLEILLTVEELSLRLGLPVKKRKGPGRPVEEVSFPEYIDCFYPKLPVLFH